ncbi:hypothetical protein ACIPW9_36235 [Streptomyces sp. NPDC090052]|uniref:hypothetical protein n=1 Tax=Streptomyces sp. NPDC090052 TaxID=3365931 RepID=UPI003814E07D
MKLFRKIAGTPEARTAHRKAKDELERVSRRDRDETDAYVAANQAVIDAEQDLPRWRRGPS